MLNQCVTVHFLWFPAPEDVGSLGIESGYILDSQLLASSSMVNLLDLEQFNRPQGARFSFSENKNFDNDWRPDIFDTNGDAWIQVSFILTFQSYT